MYQLFKGDQTGILRKQAKTVQKKDSFQLKKCLQFLIILCSV